MVGLAVALRRHQLFDIERLVNRSLVYGIVLAVLVAAYAGLVGLLAVALDLSDAVAAALAAAVVALVLAPLRGLASRTVNRLMYGHRDDPARVLNDLGTRLQAVMLPGDVLPAAVAAVADSLRVPYVARRPGRRRRGVPLAAEHGRVVGPEHATPLVHHGETVGRLRVSGRGRDDPLDATDLALIDALASQVGPAVQAVRLHEDLVRSRAAVVASREDERRRLRRDLHDGLGPSLAAIRLKAGPGRPRGGRRVADPYPAGPDRQRGASRASPTSAGWWTRSARRPWTSSGWSGRSAPGAASLGGEMVFTVTGPEERTRAAGRVGDGGVPDRGGGADQRGPAQRGPALRGRRSRCEPDQVRVEVVDDGIGLDPARPPHVGAAVDARAGRGGRWPVRRAHRPSGRHGGARDAAAGRGRPAMIGLVPEGRR